MLRNRRLPCERKRRSARDGSGGLLSAKHAARGEGAHSQFPRFAVMRTETRLLPDGNCSRAPSEEERTE